ncbi:hypothetical protein PIB30_070011 [Stylosanthes scabra]|uniref:Uncharacterized protein n=1 Tax=Stylosanthes scabra TaxID=79078 RepID=A0ABU6TNJ2_9FABA|nr:hypothetical protein [Stylosanthes scabra]
MRNTIFPPKERNAVNKAHDDEKNKKLLSDSTRFYSEDPNKEKDVTLKDLPYTSKGSVENIKESLSPDQKSDGNKNVKGKNIISTTDVDGSDSDDDELDEEMEENDDDDKRKTMRKKRKKKTGSIIEIYQKDEAIVPQ